MSEIIKKYPNKSLKFIAASTEPCFRSLKAAEILKVTDVSICISESVTEFKKKRLERKFLN